MKKLIDKFGIEYLINEEKRYLIIGRNSSCDIVMPPRNGSEPRDINKCPEEYLSVSRTHASFNPQDNTIKDIRSAHGTKINGVSLREGIPYQLKNGDDLRLGSLELKYIDE